MAVHAAPDQEDLEAEEDDDDRGLAATAVSFFAPDEVAPEICLRVFGLYLRDSVERGFDTGPRAGRAMRRAKYESSAALRRIEAAAPPVITQPTNEEPMKNKPGVLPERVSEAHSDLAKRLGRPPTSVELFDAVGEDLGKTRSNVAGVAERMGLELTRLRAPRGSKPARAATTNGHRHANGKNGHGAKYAAPPPNPAADDDEATAEPRSGTAGYLAIMALQSERQKVEAELAAIDKVIERLRAP